MIGKNQRQVLIGKGVILAGFAVYLLGFDCVRLANTYFAEASHNFASLFFGSICLIGGLGFSAGLFLMLQPQGVFFVIGIIVGLTVSALMTIILVYLPWLLPFDQKVEDPSLDRATMGTILFAGLSCFYFAGKSLRLARAGENVSH